MNNNLTYETTLTSKYQTVIPQALRETFGISEGEKLIWKVVQKKPLPLIFVLPKPKNWSTYLSGLGKRVWRNVRVEQYLQNIKKEWQAS